MSAMFTHKCPKCGYTVMVLGAKTQCICSPCQKVMVMNKIGEQVREGA